jgi:hypothetical protein
MPGSMSSWRSTRCSGSFPTTAASSARRQHVRLGLRGHLGDLRLCSTAARGCGAPPGPLPHLKSPATAHDLYTMVLTCGNPSTMPIGTAVGGIALRPFPLLAAPAPRRVRKLPDVLGERSLGPPHTWTCNAGPTVSRPTSKATSWLAQAARPFRGSRRSLGALSFHGLICPATSMRLAPDVEGFSPQKAHRWPQLLSTFRANACSLARWRR